MYKFLKYQLRPSVADIGLHLQARALECEAWPDEIHLHMVLLDDAADFEPQAHTYVKNKQRWVHMQDGLPTHRTFSDSEV